MLKTIWHGSNNMYSLIISDVSDTNMSRYCRPFYFQLVTRAQNGNIVFGSLLTYTLIRWPSFIAHLLVFVAFPSRE